MFRRDEPRPFLIQQHAVGLHAVPDGPARRLELPLQFHYFAEEIQAQTRWLAAMQEKTTSGPADASRCWAMYVSSTSSDMRRVADSGYSSRLSL